MDEKLARGHATAYINSLQDFGQILDWVKGPRRRKAMATFDRSSFYKKPGRVLNRLAPILRPQFQRSKIDQWTRQHKGISAIGLASSACRIIQDHFIPSGPSSWWTFCWRSITIRPGSME